MKITGRQLKKIIAESIHEGQDMTSDNSRAMISDVEQMFKKTRFLVDRNTHKSGSRFQYGQSETTASLDALERKVLSYIKELIYELEGDV